MFQSIRGIRPERVDLSAVAFQHNRNAFQQVFWNLFPICTINMG